MPDKVQESEHYALGFYSGAGWPVLYGKTFTDPDKAKEYLEDIRATREEYVFKVSTRTERID